MTGHMVEHALIAALVAPALVLLLRPVPRVLPLAAWAVFVGIMWVLNVPEVVDWIAMRPVAHVLADTLMIGAAFLFWTPLLGRRRRVRSLGAGAYLITAVMASDLIGAWYMAMGETAAGVAMVAGMLPFAVAAVVLTWTGLKNDERRAVRWETFADAAR